MAIKIVDLNFGGTAKKNYKMKFGVKAFTQVEELAGKPMSDLDMDKMETIFILVTASIRWMDAKITVDKVMDMFDNWTEAVAEEKGISVFEAMALAMEELSELLGEAMGTAPNEQK